MSSLLIRAQVLNKVLARLGTARALEASITHAPAEPSKMGCNENGDPIVGVDYDGKKYRARIRYCDALSGADVRVTLIRTDSLEDADCAYRWAHVVLWGSASWAACDDIIDAIRQSRKRGL